MASSSHGSPPRGNPSYPENTVCACVSKVTLCSATPPPPVFPRRRMSLPVMLWVQSGVYLHLSSPKANTAWKVPQSSWEGLEAEDIIAKLNRLPLSKFKRLRRTSHITQCDWVSEEGYPDRRGQNLPTKNGAYTRIVLSQPYSQSVKSDSFLCQRVDLLYRNLMLLQFFPASYSVQQTGKALGLSFNT